MEDDEASAPDQPKIETEPYKFKQKDEGMGKKLDKTFSGVIANKKTIAIIAGILILIVVGGTLTGSVIKTTSDLKKCQNGLTDSYAQAAELNSNITRLQTEVYDLSGNISAIGEAKNACETDYNSCLQDYGTAKDENKVLEANVSDLSQAASTAQGQLDSCNGDLDTAKTNLEKTTNQKEQMEEKYAKYKCCVFYQEGYKYYSSTGDEISCCYNGTNGYRCGFGPSETDTPEDQIKILNC